MKNFFLSAFLLLTLQQSFAQYETPTIDATFIAAEYSNTWSDGTRTFYCTWDATYFYFGVTDLNASTNPFQIYFDATPQPLPTSGTNADGSTVGFGLGFGGWDGVAYGQLPIRANSMVLIGNGTVRGCNSDGANDWNIITFSLDYGEDAALNARECRIPWTLINGGTIPATMNIFFYVSFPGSNYYGGCSNTADDDFTNTSDLTGRHYFNISQLTDATAGTAFSRLSFVNARANKNIYGSSYFDLASSGGQTITINQPVTVTGSVVLNNGFIQLSGNNLTLNGATFNRTAPGHVITFDGTDANAVLRNNINAPFTFEVGTATEYTPATLSPSVASDFNVGVFTPTSSTGVPGDPDFTPGQKLLLINANWDINRTAGSGNVDVTLNWTSALEGGSFSSIPDANIGISRYNGTLWENFIQNSASNATNTVTATFSSFSPFIVGPVSGALPVTFTSFNGVVENGKAKLSWAAQETDNLSHYEMEQSANSISFKKIRSIERKDLSGSGNYVSFDDDVLTGAKYYRIAAVGKDGDRRYTQTLRLNNGKSKNFLQLFTTADGSQLAIRLNGIQKGNYQMTVISSNGQVVFNRNLVHNGSDQTQMINLSRTLSSGVYNVVIRGEGQVYNQSFIR